MDNLKGYSCPKCASALSLDNENTEYYCLSCGARFPHTYFASTNTLKEARLLMQAGQFKDAEGVIQNVLSEESDSFEAHRLRVLCKMKWKNMQPLTTNKPLHGAHESEVTKAIQEAYNAVPSDNKPYFQMLQELIDIEPEYEARLAEKNNIDKIIFEKRTDLIGLHHNQTIVTTTVVLITIITMSAYLLGNLAHEMKGMLMVLIVGYIFTFIVWLIMTISVHVARGPLREEISKLEEENKIITGRFNEVDAKIKSYKEGISAMDPDIK